MPILKVYSINGQGRREIMIPGRSAMRPYGAVQIVNNVGDRRESDWEAIKAAIGAGNVVICLSNYETDVLPQNIQGKFAFGGNVRFETKKTPQWQLVEYGPFAQFQDIAYQCLHCGENFETAFHLAGHARRQHRHLVEREEALAAEGR